MEVVQFFLILLYIAYGECQMKPFIVGGENASIFKFSYVAYLGLECVDEKDVYIDSWLCGSSILNQDLTLTAGHCVSGCRENTLIIVSVGHEKKLEGAISTGHSFMVHENYSAMWMANDIAIVRLKTPIQLNLYVSRVALMEKPPYEEEAELAGWGIIDENEYTLADTLKYIKINVWEKKDCVDLFKRMVNGTFCAGSKNNSSYVSHGDSGSPLVVRGYIQLGILSSKSTKYRTTVAVYTDVAYFYDWIMEHAHIIMCPHKCPDCIII